MTGVIPARPATSRNVTVDGARAAPSRIGTAQTARVIIYQDSAVGQPILAAADFRGGSEPDHRIGSCCCKAKDFPPERGGRLKSCRSHDWLSHGAIG